MGSGRADSAGPSSRVTVRTWRGWTVAAWIREARRGLLYPAAGTRTEIERQAQQIKNASVIVVGLQHTENYRVLLHYSELDRALDGTRRIFHGKYFDVYVRDVYVRGAP